MKSQLTREDANRLTQLIIHSRSTARALAVYGPTKANLAEDADAYAELLEAVSELVPVGAPRVADAQREADVREARQVMRLAP